MLLLRNTVKTNSGTSRSQSASAGKGGDMSELQDGRLNSSWPEGSIKEREQIHCSFCIVTI